MKTGDKGGYVWLWSHVWSAEIVVRLSEVAHRIKNRKKNIKNRRIANTRHALAVLEAAVRMCWPPDDLSGNTLMAKCCRNTGIAGDTDRKTTAMNNERDLRLMRNETTMSVAHSMNNQFSRNMATQKFVSLEKCVVCAHSLTSIPILRSVKTVEHKQHSSHYSITHQAFLFTGRITMGSIVQSSIGLENRSFFHLELRRRTRSLDRWMDMWSAYSLPIFFFFSSANNFTW